VLGLLGYNANTSHESAAIRLQREEHVES
jgi:hypothetical protein